MTNDDGTVVRDMHVNRTGVRDGEIDLEIVMTPAGDDDASMRELDVTLFVIIERGTPGHVEAKITPNQTTRAIATLALDDDFDYTKPAKVQVTVLHGTRFSGHIEQLA